jgi:glycerol-3-phosphate dehydrogenase
MPITEMTYQVLFDGLDPRRAVGELMLRAPRHELHGVGRA